MKSLMNRSRSIGTALIIIGGNAIGHSLLLFGTGTPVSRTLSGPLMTLIELLFVVIAGIGIFLVGLGIDLAFEFSYLTNKTNPSHRTLIIFFTLAFIVTGTNIYLMIG